MFGEKGGSIINMGTARTRNPGPAMVLYLLTKGSIDIITQVLAKEPGPKKIRVGSEFEKHVI